jgi:hypothetical protein
MQQTMLFIAEAITTAIVLAQVEYGDRADDHHHSQKKNFSIFTP